MSSILHGIRVIDLTEGMLSLAGGVLADHGAEVIKVEPPGGDWTRSNPGFHLWNRGKLGLMLDSEDTADRQLIRQLALNADILIHSFDLARARELGLDSSALQESSPRLIVCSVTGFGETSRYAAFGLHERIVMAQSGRLMGNGPLSGSRFEGDRPIYLTAPIASFGAAMLALQGIVASLIVRRQTGRGQKVDTSLLDGISASTMRLAFERKGNSIVPVFARNASSMLVLRGIRLCFMTMETRDGRYIQMCSRQKHLFRNWMHAIGLGELYETERWADLPLGVRSYEDADEWERLVREHMKQRTQAEWMELFRKIDVGADPFFTFDEFLEHPQMYANERICVIEDAEWGPVRQIGPLINFEQTPAECTRPAPRLAEHQSMLSSLCARREPESGAPAASPRGGTRAGALGGLTIVEAASFLAAPLGPSLLAELGARVIKIEPLDGDPFRSSGLEFVHIGNGKESLSVDLKTADGQVILQRIIAGADAFIHNFRPGVPEKIGLGYERLREVNPSLVYLYGASYGSRGPEKHRAAFHSTPNALSGGGILQAGHGNTPVNDSYGDPCSGLVTGVALVLGLYARALTGSGQYLETSMISSVGFVHSALLVRFAGAPRPRELDQEQRGIHALDRLYRCASGWVMVSALKDHEWKGLAHLLSRTAWLDDARFCNAESRLQNDASLTELLEERFASADAAEWERRALSARVPLAVADRGTFEEYLVSEGQVKSAEHAAFGTYWQVLPRIRLSETPTSVGAPCALGEHTVELLREFQFTQGEIAGFIQRGAVRTAEIGDTTDSVKKREASSERAQAPA